MKHEDLERALSVHFAADEQSCGRVDAVLRDAANDGWEAALEAHRAHIEGCATCAAVLTTFGRLDADGEDDAALFSNLGAPVDDAPVAANPIVQPGIEMRSPLQPTAPRRSLRALAAVVAVAAAMGLMWIVAPSTPTEPDDPIAKGDWMLHVGIKRDGQTRRHVTGQRFADGDELGFFYSSPADGFLVLLFVDDAGQHTPLVPRSGGQAMAIPGGAEVRLDAGGQLTATERCEWLVGVFASTPFDQTEVVERLRVRPTDGASACRAELRERSGWSVQIIRLRR